MISTALVERTDDSVGGNGSSNQYMPSPHELPERLSPQTTSRESYQRLNQSLDSFNQALDNIRDADLSSLRDPKLSEQANNQVILSVRNNLRRLIGNDHENLSNEQLKLINSINKLSDYQGPSRSISLKREEIIASVFQSVANGPDKFGQGNSPSCTATVAGKLIMNHKGIGSYAELMTNLLINGSHGELRLNESGFRKEASMGVYAGASIAECIFRSSVMELSNKMLESKYGDITIVYSDTAYGEGAQGVSFIYDNNTGDLIGTYQGMHAEGWLLAQEELLGCGVEFLKSTQDGGSVSPSDILAQMVAKGGTHGCAIAYDKHGLHDKHFVEFREIKNGRVYFANPHKNLHEGNFSKKADSHILVGAGIESMSIADFEERLLSAGLIHLDKPAGHFQDTNDYGDESFQIALDWYKNNRSSGNNHMIIHEGLKFNEGTKNPTISQNRMDVYMNANNTLSQDLGNRTYYAECGFASQSELERARYDEGDIAWHKRQQEILREKELESLRVLMGINKMRIPKEAINN